MNVESDRPAKSGEEWGSYHRLPGSNGKPPLYLAWDQDAIEAELREQEQRGNGGPTASYEYRDENGKLLRTKYRFADGAAKPWSRKGPKVKVPYRLPELIEGVRAGRVVWIVDGEKDVEALRSRGEIATCSPDGMANWRDEYGAWLQGASKVWVVQDRDSGAGEKGADKVRTALQGVVPEVAVVQAAEGKDAYDHFDAGHGLEDFVAVQRPRLEVYSLADAFGWADEDVDWVVPQLLAAGEKMVLAGPPKAMKTWLELHIALTVTTGGDVLGEPLWHVTEPQGTLVVQEESQRQRWGRRIKDVFEDFPDAPFKHTHRAGFSLMDKANVDWLIREVTERGIRLVCIDPLQRVTPGVKENDTGEMAVPWDAIHRIATETGAAVIVVHHTRKGDSTPSMEAIRGSSRTAGEVDVLLVVQKDAYGTLECFLEGRELIRSEVDNLLIKFDTTAPWRMAFAGVKIKTSGPVNKTVRAVEKVLRGIDEAHALSVKDIRTRVQAELNDTRTTESIRNALKDLAENGELASKSAPNGTGNAWWATDAV